jgi:hypothetical protein
MRRAGVLLALVWAGCSSSDPCDGQSGICLSARVEGNVSGLDQLRFSLDLLPTEMPVSPSVPSSFSLPVKVAVLFPAAAAHNGNLTVFGLKNGNVIASSGPVPISIPQSGRFSQTFTLIGPGGPDGGGGDANPNQDGGGLDGPPSGVFIDNPSLAFPDTPRGTTSPTMLNFKVTNATNATASLTSVTTTGDMNSFKVNPTSTDPNCQQMMPTVAAGTSCDFSVTFTPATSGALQQINQLTFSNGMSATLAISGNGLRAWSIENVHISGMLQAVWGSSANDLYAVGLDSAGQGVYHSTGDGNWTNCVNAGQTINGYSIGGRDATLVLVGGEGGSVFTSAGGCIWTATSTANAGWSTSSNVRGVFFDAGTSLGWGVTDTGYVAQYQPVSQSWTAYTSYVTSPTQLNAVFGPFSGTLAWGGSQAGNGFAAGYSPLVGGNITLPPPGQVLTGIWGDSASVWGVGNNIYILRYDFATLTNAPTQEAIVGGAGGNFLGVSGRIDPMGNSDIYAVGDFGNQLLHREPDATWHSIQLPDNQANNSVWVASTGEVIVSGFPTPTIQHLY